MPNCRAITKIWNSKGLVKFTFHICQYYFSKTRKYINLIVDLCTNVFTWLLNCRFLSVFIPNRSMLSFTGILVSFTVKLNMKFVFPKIIA